MHSISPYIIRSTDSAEKRKDPKKPQPLNNIKGKDAFEILKEFLKSRTGNLNKYDDDKRVYNFSDLHCDDTSREIYGFMQCGFFGVGSDIVDIVDGKIVHRKKPNNADLIKYFVHAFFPKDCDEAIIILGLFRGDGIKTIFSNEFNAFFRQRIPQPVTINPLSYEKAMREWQAAITKEIKVIGFNRLEDIAEADKFGGHLERELKLKPPGRFTFGPFAKIFQPGSTQNRLVESLRPLGGEIKASVKLGSKTRTFRVGITNDNTICQIDLDDCVQLVDGMPEINSMLKWTSTIMSDLCETLYVGNNAFPKIKRNFYELKN